MFMKMKKALSAMLSGVMLASVLTMSSAFTAQAATTVNPKDYDSKTTVTLLSASVSNVSQRTQEFQYIVKDCTKVAYAYADPRENVKSSLNTSTSGSSSFAAYIFGYNDTSTTAFLNAKKLVPYILNKIYFDSSLKSKCYTKLIGSKKIYIIIEPASKMDGNSGIKFGNVNDGFGVQISADVLVSSNSDLILHHEIAHAIWDVLETDNSFYFGVDSRTNINYGTGNFVTLWNELYNNSITSNQFYSNMYGWDYSHENFAESSAYFFDSNWRSQLKTNDPIVYSIMKQIYTEF